MKKFFLSTTVIVSFLLYSFYERVLGSQSMPVTLPKNTTDITSIETPTPSPTTMPTSTPTSIPTIGITGAPSPINTPVPTTTPVPTRSASGLRDGTYTGDAADAFYGNIQVQVSIGNGKITNIVFLQAPNDRNRSIEINQQADPMLAQEAIQSQSANVDIISGATDSSNAFIQSLQSALTKAKG